MLYRFLTTLVFAFLFTVTSVNAQNTQFYSGSFESLTQKASVESKPYFVAFHIPGCVPCKRMLDNVYSNSEVAEMANGKYIPFKIGSPTYANEILRRKHNVNQFPTIVFFDANGKETGRVVGFRGVSVFKEDLVKYAPKAAHSSLTGFR